MRLCWFLGIASIFLIAATQPPHDSRRMFLDRVEKNVRLPAGARPLKAYFRSYFPAQGGAKIMGVYSTLRPPGREWVAQNPGPFIADGGCTIVTIVIDAGTGAVDSAECNGVG